MQMTLSGAERQICVADLSGPTAGERSVSASGHQSSFVNFLHTADQLLSPPNTDFSCGSLEYKKIEEVGLLYSKNILFYLLNLNIFRPYFVVNYSLNFH